MLVSVCNLRSSDFDHTFRESVINTGFAVLTHHGVDFGLIKETQKGWREFFNSPLSNKDQYVDPLDPNLGYRALGSEKAVGANIADLKMFYHFKPGVTLPPEVDHVTRKLFFLLEDTAGQVMRALDGVGSSMRYSQVCEGSDNTILRALYYPPLKDIEPQLGAVRAAEHTDINFLTLLVAASSPGLQVKDVKGNYFDVPFEENSIVVNIGDQLQLASNYAFKSTVHRVVNPSDLASDRLSIPLFVHANSDTMLVPGVTAQQYLTQRLNEIYKGGYK
jgi:isopenicillin N synthase-like dioxygenase